MSLDDQFPFAVFQSLAILFLTSFDGKKGVVRAREIRGKHIRGSFSRLYERNLDGTVTVDTAVSFDLSKYNVSQI